MDLDRINTNNTYPQQALSNEQIESEKKSNSLFDNFFQKKDDVDTNNDGTVSFDEAIEYIQKYYKSTNPNTREIILKIAAFLGVEKKNNSLNINEDTFFYQEIIENIELLKKADKNKDENVSFEEAKYANNLEKKEKVKLNRIFGIIDNKFNNKQGTFGTCHLLTSGDGIAQKAPETFSQIIKENEKGDITVTFYGTNDKPFHCTIPNRIIQRKQQIRTQMYNNTIAYGARLGKFGSNDAEAIALEITLAHYESFINKQNEEYLKNLQNYIDNAEYKMVEKPSIEGLTYENITQEKLDELQNYYKNSVNNEGERGCHIFAFSRKKSSLTREQFDWFTQEYFPNSTPTILEKPKNLNYSSELKNWIENSYSNSLDKPEIKPRKSYPTLNSGWYTRDTIKLLAGGTWKHYEHKTTDESKILEELSTLTLSPSNSKETTVDIATTSFIRSNLNESIKPNHAYLINYATEDYVMLTDPHDSTKMIRYSINDFLKNYSDLSINTIPRKIAE